MADRKKDHIDLAFSSRIEKEEADARFFYEPLLAAHHDDTFKPFRFAGKTMTLPVWVSSMTGGTQMAGTINRNLARACGEFGLGMGLGSCRALLKDSTHLEDFNIRKYMGHHAPLYANLGIAQLEELVKNKQTERIDELVHQLSADGIIIHVNPLQEAFQPEGDLLEVAPIETLENFLSGTSLRVIVKEVGQGMGPQSLERLLALPLQAIEFGALGGTNFTRLEQARHAGTHKNLVEAFAHVGHTALEMTQMVNHITSRHPTKCKELIISGGITQVTQGYYLMQLSQLKSVFGMGSAFLKYALDDYETLSGYVKQLKKGLGIATQYLKVKE